MHANCCIHAINIPISGLHITMIAGLAALVVSSLWRRSFFIAAQLPLRPPAPKVWT